MRSSVVLPQPEAPTIEMNWPASTLNETSCSASTRCSRRVNAIEMPRASSLTAPLPVAIELLQLELAPGREALFELLQQHDRQYACTSQDEHADPHRVDLE